MRVIFIVLLTLSLAIPLSAAEYFVSATDGDDTRDGLSPATAWQTLERVNAASLEPGDTVRFRSGDTWRGRIKPKSGSDGSPVIYTSYGEGNKPLILGSIPLKACWTSAGDNLWQTPEPAVRLLNGKTAFLTGAWHLHCEQGAKAEVVSTATPHHAEIHVTAQGTRPNHIQWYNAKFPIHEGTTYAMQLNVKSSRPLTLAPEVFRLSKAGPPYDGYGEIAFYQCREITPTEKEYLVLFTASTTADDARVTFSLGGRLADDLTLRLAAGVSLGEVVSLHLSTDVGNLIFDGSAAGWKRWGRDELKQQGDFYYDPAAKCVVLYSEKHPDEAYGVIEAAMKRHIVEMSGTSWCVFDGLDIRYGAAHGFGGSNTAHYVIRNCDLSWIGGAHQFTREDGKPVRYGNAIEFWANARDHLVENNRIWEVYDAALTNQGDGVNVQKNITYRGNEVWNCEYSFEYWNRGPESVTDNILVEGNTFRDAGCGWGHCQRPDPNGRHVMIYDNPAKTTAVRIINNRMQRATESIYRVTATRGQEAPGHQGDGDIPWTRELELDRNTYIQTPDKPFALWGRTNYTFAEFQKATGKEKGSEWEGE